MNQHKPGLSARFTPAWLRRIPPGNFLAIYALALLSLALISIYWPRQLFLMILTTGPVLYAAFAYPRRIYQAMIVLTLLVEIVLTWFIAADRPGTLALVLLVAIPVTLLAEMSYRMVQSRAETERALEASEERYRSFVTRVQGIAFQYPLDRPGYDFIHGQVEEITGYSEADFLQGRVDTGSLVCPEDRDWLRAELERLHTLPGYTFDQQYRFCVPGKPLRWLHEVSQSIPGPDGRPYCVQGNLFDVTRQKEIEAALRENQAYFQSLFDNSPISLWDEDFSGVKVLIDDLLASGVRDLRAYLHDRPDELLRLTDAIVVNDVNRAALELMGVRTREELLEKISAVLGRTLSDSMVEEFCAIAEGKTYFQWSGMNDIVDGQPRYHRVTWSVAPGSEKSYRRVIVAVDDITETKRTEEALRFLTSHDVQTGIYNRTFFDAELERLNRGRVHPISIIFADMDGLKATNDIQGHAVGDELLSRAAHLLRDSFRVEDVVARIGGDEFGVLLPGVGAAGAREALERVRRILTAHNSDHPEKTPVRFSMGVATAEQGEDLNEVLRLADERMYRDKAARRP